MCVLDVVSNGFKGIFHKKVLKRPAAEVGCNHRLSAERLYTSFEVVSLIIKHRSLRLYENLSNFLFKLIVPCIVNKC